MWSVVKNPKAVDVPASIGCFKSRISIAAFLRCGRGMVAGILESRQGRWVLSDTSGELVIPFHQHLTPPCWAALDYENRQQFQVRYVQKINPDQTFQRMRMRAHPMRKRWHMYQAIRTFFLDRDFLEADTPVRVSCPGMEPYLDTFSAGDRFLRTSPELHMKRLLAAGFDRIFQMAPCFRKGDLGSIHREEFQLLEWYRAFADLNHLMDDVGALLRALSPCSEDAEYFSQPPEVVTCQEVFRRYLGLELLDQKELGPLRQCLIERGINPSPEDDWDTLYFLLFLNFIEPKLGIERPLILKNYPASQAALAKLAPEQPGVMPYCYRFELYIRGVELANAFFELTDPVEQRRRFEADRKTRSRLGKVVYDLDEPFLAALQTGLPPSAGIALGLDRLVMVLLNQTRLEEILPW